MSCNNPELKRTETGKWRQKGIDHSMKKQARAKSLETLKPSPRIVSLPSYPETQNRRVTAKLIALTCHRQSQKRGVEIKLLFPLSRFRWSSSTFHSSPASSFSTLNRDEILRCTAIATTQQIAHGRISFPQSTATFLIQSDRIQLESPPTQTTRPAKMNPQNEISKNARRLTQHCN